jgi:type IV fimbrial biogenesis protein FimT
MKQRGLTLVELLTIVAISVILLTMGVPGYAYFLNQNRLAGVTNELVTSLNLARSEAIKRGVRVTLCKSANAMDEYPVCAPETSWLEGWLVFVDRGMVGQLDGTDKILWVQNDRPNAQASISVSNNFNTYASYLPSGVSQGSNHLPNGTFNICIAGQKRRVILNSTGRIKIAKETC